MFSLLPILVGMGVHFYDCYEFLTEGLSDNVVVWQGYPYSVLWYAFFFVALQVIPICTYILPQLLFRQNRCKSSF